jgi:hypothetical protein
MAAFSFSFGLFTSRLPRFCLAMSRLFFGMVSQDGFDEAWMTRCRHPRLLRRCEPMTIPALDPSRSDQAQQQRAPEEENQEGNGQCLPLLADEDFQLPDHDSLPRRAGRKSAAKLLFPAQVPARAGKFPSLRTRSAFNAACAAYRKIDGAGIGLRVIYPRETRTSLAVVS